MWYQFDYCRNAAGDCGWWYTPALDGNPTDDFYVSCDEFYSWEKCASPVFNSDGSSCYGDWIWEECSQKYWQNDYCREDNGWWYTP